MKILRIKLNDAYRSMHNSRVQILHLVKKITHCIPTFINNLFFKKQEQSLHYFYLHKRQNIDKKIRWLLKKKVNDSAHNIKTIIYYCHVPTDTVQPATMTQHEKQFSFSQLTPHKDDKQIIIQT